jgi:hypothetical protein
MQLRYEELQYRLSQVMAIIEVPKFDVEVQTINLVDPASLLGNKKGAAKKMAEEALKRQEEEIAKGRVVTKREGAQGRSLPS